MSAKSDLLAHLATGATTTCQAWSVRRGDGAIYGFTDHDRDLSFDGVTYKASSGMTARALQQTTGLSVDNSEALGALSDVSICEADVMAGRFDCAVVENWLVNWAAPSQRMLQFRGTLGEISRAGGSFRAELRGLTEMLNQPQGRVYQKTCPAVLGDRECRFDLDATGYSFAAVLRGRDEDGAYLFDALPGVAEHWLERGRFVVQSGGALGLVGVIKSDKVADGGRSIRLWAALGMEPVAGEQIRLEAGCDKLAATCQGKFNNFPNFRGFPHIPGDDWLTSYPVSSQINDGGSLMK